MKKSKLIDQQQVTSFRNIDESGYRAVSRSTVQRRLNLAMGQRGEVIRKCGQANRYHDVLGDFYLEDAETRRIIMPHVNLVSYAKRFRVIHEDEKFYK
jgi:hypothetical protein